MNLLKLKCGTCRHFDGENEDLAKQGDGQCRAHAPAVSVVMVPARTALGQGMMAPQSFSSFPQVSAENCFCSEWAKSFGRG